MRNFTRHPWAFALVAACILVVGGVAVGLSAHLVVAPRTGSTVEVDTAYTSINLGQSVDSVTFYPWKLYNPQTFQSNVAEETSSILLEWYLHNLTQIPALLGLSGMENSLAQGQVGEYAGYWVDCPVTGPGDQPALLDVAFGLDYQDFGMTWVAHATGDLPTRAQKEAAVNQVQQDVCAMLTASGQETALEQLLSQVWSSLNATSALKYDPDLYVRCAQDVLHQVMRPMQTSLPAVIAVDPTQSVSQQLMAISTAARTLDYHIQLVTTQRQVVLVLTNTFADTDSWYSVGVYYDMVLERYTGIALNSREGYGY